MVILLADGFDKCSKMGNAVNSNQIEQKEARTNLNNIHCGYNRA